MCNNMGFFAYILFTCVLKFSVQTSTPADDSYVAAAVEYQVRNDTNENLNNYVRLIQDAAEQNADIVVFPEMTLTTSNRSIVVPMRSLLVTHRVPALEPNLFDEILVTLSSAARRNQIYVVVNFQEIMDCTNASEEYCPEAKVYKFNTNIVLDRDGAIIDRYRKINLFGEYTRDPALRPELGVFYTDFGVTFGHFICFDLMFQVPSIQVVQKYNLTDVLFTTMWFSELPFLTAVQIQEAYAYTLNVNFIASGANNVRIGSAGSGIYSGKAGALVSIMPGVPTTRLLVSRVPKVPGQVATVNPETTHSNPSEKDQLALLIDPSLPSFTSRLLVPGFQEFVLEDKEVSCKFRVKIQEGGKNVVPQFRAIIKNGVNINTRRTLGLAACAVLACKDDNFSSCPYRYTAEEMIEIEELEIEVTTYRSQYNTSLDCNNIVYYPLSLTIEKYPLKPKLYTYIENQENEISSASEDEIQTAERKHITYKLNAPQKNIVNFGIWGRVFTRDNSDNGNVTEKEIEDFVKFENRIYNDYGVQDNAVN